MNLYEIDSAILECVDAETGELIDPERLESLYMERNQKIENVALWIKNLQADELAYKAEKDAFEKREKAAAAKVEQLKKWLTYATGGNPFSTTRCAVSFRKSTRLDVVDVSAIPKQFLVETVTVKPDANAIKAVMKDGAMVSGCRLIENQNIQIR